MSGINNFLNTVFDDYAREYGEYFKDEVVAFDDKFERIKNEIYLNSQADKNYYPQMDTTQIV